MFNLRSARVNKGLTIDDVAKKINVSSKTLSHWERGITAIPTNIFYKLCDLYEVQSDIIKVPTVKDGKYNS